MLYVLCLDVETAGINESLYVAYLVFANACMDHLVLVTSCYAVSSEMCNRDIL